MDELSQREIMQMREAFFSSGGIEAQSVPHHLWSPWKRCLDLGFSPEGPALPPSALRQHERLSEARRYTFDCLRRINQRALAHTKRAFDEFGIALFTIADFEEDLLVYGCGGCERTLSMLEGAGIATGTSFLEAKMGISVVSESLRNESAVWAIGAENFFEALHGFAMCAQPMKAKGSHTHIGYAQLPVVPLGEFTEKTRGVIELYLGSGNLTDTTLFPQIAIRDLSFERFLQQSKMALIIVNRFDCVIDVSGYCGELLGVGYLDCCGQIYYNVIPQLRQMHAKAGPTKSARAVAIAPNQEEVIFEYRPIFSQGRHLGAAIFATSAESIKNRAESVVDSRSHCSFDDIIGKSRPISSALRLAKAAAPNRSSILLIGEEGTGKELFARAIHSSSNRATKPFVTLNCGGLLESMAEATVFGSVARVFSHNQQNDSIGKIEQADGGTLFLKNVDMLPLQIQSALASVLKTGAVTRAGGTVERPVDVRVIASTNVDLERAVSEGSFKQDLYYCLNVIEIDIPPLRERREDIPSLARHAAATLCKRARRKVPLIDADALELMSSYDWPGNVRELLNAVERALELETDGVIGPNLLPPKVQSPSTDPASRNADQAAGCSSWEEAELDEIRRLMHAFGGNKTKVAKELGVSRTTLYKRLKEIEFWG